MRWLIISQDFSWVSGAYRLQNFERQEVRAFSRKDEGKGHLKGVIEQVSSIREGLDWVGKNGYVICDGEEDVSLLRRAGYRVYGNNRFLERMENDRLFELGVAKSAGINVPNYHPIKSLDEGIRFVKANPDAYVIKQTGLAPKELNYVGKEDDGSDVIRQLEWMKTRDFGAVEFILQELCEGIEFAVGAWWQYDDWFKDSEGNILIELNREHKKMLNGDRGISCGEMGTVMRFSLTDRKLFEETLARLTPILREKCSDVCVDIDANCVVTEENGLVTPYLLETTPREGYPACTLQQYLLNTGLSEFMSSLIDNDYGDFNVKKGWGVVTNLGCGTYPHDFGKKENPNTYRGQPVIMDPTDHLLPCDLTYDHESGIWKVSDDYGWVATACYHGDIFEANRKCVEAMQSVQVRNPVYRTDIGEKFRTEELPKLEAWGYVEPAPQGEA